MHEVCVRWRVDNSYRNRSHSSCLCVYIYILYIFRAHFSCVCEMTRDECVMAYILTRHITHILHGYYAYQVSVSKYNYSQSHLGWHFRKLKAQSSNVSFATFQWNETFELWALSFETAFENVTPNGIGYIWLNSTRIWLRKGRWRVCVNVRHGTHVYAWIFCISRVCFTYSTDYIWIIFGWSQSIRFFEISWVDTL